MSFLILLLLLLKLLLIREELRLLLQYFRLIHPFLQILETLSFVRSGALIRLLKVGYRGDHSKVNCNIIYDKYLNFISFCY